MSSLRSPLPLFFLGAALCLGAATFAPSVQAQACSDPISVHSSSPADGATGVPINTPVFVWGPALTVNGFDITLEASNGQAVMVEVLEAEGGGGLLVDPFLGLAASTRYELTVAPRAGGEAWSASFTTGTGTAAPVQLEAPEVTVRVIEQNTGTCYATAICVSAEIPARMALEVVVRDEVMNLGRNSDTPAFLATESVASNGCVTVRVREPGGLLSPTTRVCGDDLERFVLEDPDSPTPRSCSNIESNSADGGSEDAGGCALGTPGTASGAGGLLVGLSALLIARQRRRARR
jgi:hypothetical protein